MTFTELQNCDEEYRPMVGDGECDDLTNTANCNYDEGDCCLDPIDDTYCIRCLCSETGIKHQTYEELYQLLNKTEK